MDIYKMNYEPKEVNRKIRSMFNKKNLSVESADARGYVLRYSLTSDQVIAFLDRWSPLKNTYGIRERAALASIEQVLGITIERQVKFGCFRVDGYHRDSNTVYEIDEEQHYRRGVLIKSCENRQRFIEDKFHCTVVRIKV